MPQLSEVLLAETEIEPENRIDSGYQTKIYPLSVNRNQMRTPIELESETVMIPIPRSIMLRIKVFSSVLQNLILIILIQTRNE